MGLRLSKKIKIVTLLEKKYRNFPNFDVCGEVTVKKDVDFNITDIELKFDGYFPAIICLWPVGRDSPQISPVVSSIGCSIDTVN